MPAGSRWPASCSATAATRTSTSRPTRPTRPRWTIRCTTCRSARQPGSTWCRTGSTCATSPTESSWSIGQIRRSRSIWAVRSAARTGASRWVPHCPRTALRSSPPADRRQPQFAAPAGLLAGAACWYSRCGLTTRAVTWIALLLAVTFALSASAARAATLSFSPAGPGGGGFQNVVASDPASPDVLLSGGDVSGIERSTDGGASWQAVNAGLAGRPQLEGAAFLFSPVVAGRVYAAVGDAGIGGGLLESDDSGATWRMRSTVPQFAGGNAKTAGLPAEHPRSTGNLLAQDPVSGSIYAATFSQGLMRSDDGGATWSTLGLSGLHLRSLALDPSATSVLYAGSYGQGLYETTDAGGLGGFTRLATAPATVEELSIAGGTIYAAAGTGGVFASDDGGASWSQLGAGQLRAGSMWTSIAAWTGCDGA